MIKFKVKYHILIEKEFYSFADTREECEIVIANHMQTMETEFAVAKINITSIESGEWTATTPAKKKDEKDD